MEVQRQMGQGGVGGAIRQTWSEWRQREGEVEGFGVDILLYL